eukprot:2108332-Rhodomonas_salina.1
MCPCDDIQDAHVDVVMPVELIEQGCHLFKKLKHDCYFSADNSCVHCLILRELDKLNGASAEHVVSMGSLHDLELMLHPPSAVWAGVVASEVQSVVLDERAKRILHHFNVGPIRHKHHSRFFLQRLQKIAIHEEEYVIQTVCSIVVDSHFDDNNTVRRELKQPKERI